VVHEVQRHATIATLPAKSNRSQTRLSNRTFGSEGRVFLSPHDFMNHHRVLPQGTHRVRPQSYSNNVSMQKGGDEA
jgi:hypothetical protein